jgi:hypothetical protein
MFDVSITDLPQVQRAERQAWAAVEALAQRADLRAEYERSPSWNRQQLAELRADRERLGKLWWRVTDLGEAGA